MTELQYVQKRIRDLSEILANDSVQGNFRNNQTEALTFYLLQANKLMPLNSEFKKY